LKAQHVLNGTPLIIRSSKLYLQPLVYIPMWWPAVAKTESEMNPCIVDYSVEIPTRCSFVIEFPTQPWQQPVTVWVYKPEAANTV